MGWITTRTGNRILIGEDETLESALKNYYQALAIKPMKIDFREEMHVKSEIRQSGTRFKGENISVIVLPGNPYNMYIFSHGNGRIENARITIVDAIDHDELEYLEDDWKSRRY